MTSVKEYIHYYKLKLDRIKEDDEKTILETIHKLSKPSVTAELLQDTGIYRAVHKLTKMRGKIADSALPLYNKWKLLLSIAMKEKGPLKNFSPHLDVPHPIPGNHPSKSRPDSIRNREANSKYPDRNQIPTPKDKFVPNPTQEKLSSYRSRGSVTDRALKGQPKEHLKQDFEANRIANSSQRGFKPRDTLAPDLKSTQNPSHRSSDSDSEKGFKHQSADSERYSRKRDYITQNNNTNIFGNPCPRTFPENSETDSRVQLPKTDLFVPQTSAISNSRDTEGGPEQKDYFAPDPDATRPGSNSSDLNGACSGQDSNHGDIDSLNNPNLNIDGPHAERGNSSVDVNSDADSSPTKCSKVFEPYHIEMKEGMFVAVKSKNDYTNSGRKVFEVIHREIMKGNSSYRRDKDTFEEQKSSDATFLPKDLFRDWEKSKHEPVESKPSSEKSGNGASGSSKHDLKRKSASPCSKGSNKKIRQDKELDHRGSEKRNCPDSTSDHRLKIKKEEKSPSQAHKPINNVHAHQSNCDRNKNSKLKDSPPENAGMEFISSKKERRSIYSGKKCVQDVSTLQVFCQRFLKKNLDCIRGSLKVPYDILLPILESLNPLQLSKVEEHNPYLLPHSNGLWKQHCNRDYRGLRLMKNEKDVIWRDEYNRAHDQQQKKLKNLTASINAAASKAKPDRQAKLTLVESQHDPLRRRSKPMELPVASLKPTVGPRTSSPAISHRSTSPVVTLKTSSSPKNISVPKPSMPVIIMKPKETKHSVSHKPVKKVVAPLMSKVKKSMGSFAAYRQK